MISGKIAAHAMTSWTELLTRPDPPNEVAWFDAIAARLLHGARLRVAGAPYRLTEIEFYYFDEARHRDPFTHRNPIQREVGRWYFHRIGESYRGGSFKGVDLTFGGHGTQGGVLIRGLERPDGALVDGPSLCVDHLVAACGVGSVAALDAAGAGRLIWEPGGPLQLEASETRVVPLLRTARIGLALRSSKPAPEGPSYLLRRYRYVREPRRISKGKAHAVLALHADGVAPAQIHGLTGCPLPTITRHIADFEAGRSITDFSGYYDVEPKPPALGRMHGTWHRLWVEGAAADPTRGP